MNKSKLQVILFTNYYPYSLVEESFIDPEIPVLLSRFHSVTIIPRSFKGRKRVLPIDAIIEDSLHLKLKTYSKYKFIFKNFLFSFLNLELYKEIFSDFPKTFSPRSIIRMINSLGTALITKNWMLNYIKENNIDLKKTIFYTYWLNEITFGIHLAKKIHPDIIIISKAHGFDIYEERHNPHYIPFRPECFLGIDKIYADSEKGSKYLALKYPNYTNIFSVSRLGVPAQMELTKSSEDGVFRIVSCSYLVPVKRIELLIMGLMELGKLMDTRIFEWVHIGDGPLRPELEKISQTLLPHNVKCSFLGFLPEGGVLSYYNNNNVDLFINVSSSEGTPVSIMEAQSCSIPVIATAVGGNSEIVTNDNGLLLSENPKPDEIASAICVLANDNNLLQVKKRKSHENWSEMYNSEKNYQYFAQDIINLALNRQK